MPAENIMFFNQSRRFFSQWNTSNNATCSEIDMGLTHSSELPSEDEVTTWQESVNVWRVERSVSNMQPLAYLCYKALAVAARKESWQFEQLPLHMLDEMLRLGFLTYLKATSQRILGKFAKQLLHKDTTTFDFDVVVKGKDQAEVWDYMVKNCPNMETIIRRDYNGTPFVKFPLDDLLQMPKVVHIEMPDFWCNDDTFTQFAEHFPDLKVLHVSLGDISDVAVDNMLKLKKLERFDFHGSKLKLSNLDRDVKIMTNLLYGLPNLEVLWPTYPTKCDHNRALAWLSETNIKQPIILKKLRLCGTPKYWPEMLPHVESLFLVGQPEQYITRDLPTLSSFENLRSLSINTSSICNKFLCSLLKVYGNQLRELVIDVKCTEQDNVVLDLGIIFTTCTQLVKFHLQGKVSCDDGYYDVRYSNFSKLEDVKIRIFGDYYRSKMLSYLILHAENLKILKLGPMYLFLQNDLGAVLELYMDQNIEAFSTLRELWLTFNSLEITDEFTHLIKTMLCRATLIEKVVIEVQVEPRNRGFCPLYDELARFCEYFMPEVDFLQI